METLLLTKSQQQIFDQIEDRDTAKNFLIEGPGGVGKSVLINALVANGRKPYTLAAPTGLAANNIGGRTLHSIFRLPISEGIIEHDYNLFPTDDRVVNNIRYNVHQIIIDEISMVRSDMFDYLDRMLKHIKASSRPFGGVQMILVGDFYQLPPIVKGVDKKALLNAGFESEFIFDSKAFKAGNFEVISLTEVLRQKDPVFKSILDSARKGFVGYKDIAMLNKQVGFKNDLRIALCGANKQAEEINTTHLRNIDAGTTTYTASSFGEWKDYPVPMELELKVGAHVMVKVNGSDRPPSTKGEFKSMVVNGTLGKIVDLHQDNKVTIELDSGEEVTIYPRTWDKRIKKRSDDGTFEEIVVASYTQMPLALAWAISIHKSQGQSFDKVHVDLSRIFAPGQAYVSLSRCRSLAGLSLEAPITANKFFANKDVVRFFDTEL